MVSLRKLLPGPRSMKDRHGRHKRQKIMHELCDDIMEDDENYFSDPSSNRIGDLSTRQMNRLRSSGSSSAGFRSRLHQAQLLSTSSRGTHTLDRGRTASSRLETPRLVNDSPSANSTSLQYPHHDLSTKSSSCHTSEPQSSLGKPQFGTIHDRVPHANLTAKNIEDMEKISEKMLSTLLEEKGHLLWNDTIAMVPSPADWKVHYSLPNLNIYRRKLSTNVDTAHRQFMCMGHISANSLENIEYVLKCSTTPEYRVISSYLFRDHYLDAAVLNVVDGGGENTAGDPDISLQETKGFRFFAVKWIACSARMGMMVSNRDFAFFEYLKVIYDQHGDKILVRILHSVRENVVPSKRNDFDLVRGFLSCISLYKYDYSTNSVQIFAEGCIDPCSQVSSWLGNAYLSYMMPVITSFEGCADVKYITSHQLVAKDQRWVPDRERRMCTVCTKAFTFMKRHRHHCRICGEVMCSNCTLTLPYCVKSEPTSERLSRNIESSWSISSLLNVQQRYATMYSMPRQEKFCVKCMTSIQQRRDAELQAERRNVESLLGQETPQFSSLAFSPGSTHTPSFEKSYSNHSESCIIKCYPDFASTRGTIMEESEPDDFESSRSITESQLLRLQEEVARSSSIAYHYPEYPTSRPTFSSKFPDSCMSIDGHATNSFDNVTGESTHDSSRTVILESPTQPRIWQADEIGLQNPFLQLAQQQNKRKLTVFDSQSKAKNDTKSYKSHLRKATSNTQLLRAFSVSRTKPEELYQQNPTSTKQYFRPKFTRSKSYRIQDHHISS